MPARLLFSSPALAIALLAIAAACSGPNAPSAPSGPSGPAGASRTAAPQPAATARPATTRATTDDRVRSFRGRTPPDVFTDGTWVGSAGSTSLAALRGRVVYLQFAFPR